VIEMLARKRMSKKLKLEYSLTVVTEQLLRAVLDHPTISEIDLGGTDLTSVHPKLLSTVVTQLEQVSLAGSVLTLDQSESLFATLEQQESFRLRRLDISGLDLTLVNPDSLARALTKLEQVSLAESWLCPDQLKAFFRALTSTSTSSSTSPWSSTPRSPTTSSAWSPVSLTSQKKLAVLNLRGVPLTFLDPSSFARAISQLEEVDITETRLTRMQKRQICRILLNPSKVKKLWIDGYSFSCNNPNVTKNNKDENKFNDNEANNNAIHDLNNNANINNVNDNENQYYEAQLGGQQNHILAVGVA